MKYQTSSDDSHVTLWVALAAIAILTPILLTSLAIISFQVFEWNLPGVVIFDQPVGFKNYDTSVNLIDKVWNQSPTIQLNISDNSGVDFTVTPGELGFWIDPIATANAAYAIGRDATPFQDLIAAIQGEQQIIMPVLYFNPSQAADTLAGIEKAISFPAQDASVVFQDGNWVALPGSPGQSLDVEATVQVLSENALTILLTQTVTLPMTVVEPAIADLSPVLNDIEILLSQDLHLTAYDPITDETFTWSVPDGVKRQWVTVNTETQTVALTMDVDDVSALASGWEQELGVGRTFGFSDDLVTLWSQGPEAHVIIYHAPTTYNVSAGESLWSISLRLGIPMWYILDANDGLTVNNLETGVTLTIPSKNDLLPLPVIPNKRILIDISEQRLTVYESGEAIRTHIISTGIADSPTMAGIFQIRTHEINAYASNWDLYMPHFMGIYEAWPGFMNGIHGLPLLSGGGRLWASALGSPASYGCIILDLEAAAALYDWADPGVVVEIIP